MSKPRPRPTNSWSRAYICAECELLRKKHGRYQRFIDRTPATKRIMAFVAERAYELNIPTCDQHYPAALELVLRQMMRAWEQRHLHHDYRVEVFTVSVGEHNDPYLGRRILRVFPRGMREARRAQRLLDRDPHRTLDA